MRLGGGAQRRDPVLDASLPEPRPAETLRSQADVGRQLRAMRLGLLVSASVHQGESGCDLDVGRERIVDLGAARLRDRLAAAAKHREDHVANSARVRESCGSVSNPASGRNPGGGRRPRPQSAIL